MADDTRTSAAAGLGPADALPPGVRAVFAEAGRRDSLAAGQILFRQGDPADALYLLEEGRLEISTLSEDGRKLALNALNSGTVFGEIALFDDRLRSATVTAQEPCQLLRLDRRVLLDRIGVDPGFALEVIRLCIGRLRWVNAQLEDHVFQPLDVRLARRVLYLLETVGEGTVLAMSQAEIAGHVGVTREAAAKALAAWKKAGIAQLGRGRITITDLAGLRARAEAGTV